MSKPKITNLLKLVEEYNSGLSTVKLAKKYNTSHTVIAGWLKKSNIPIRDFSQAHKHRNIRGKNNPNFKGSKGKHKKPGKYADDGTYLSYDGNGYLRRVIKGHPLSSKSGLIGEHVYQACLKWGVDFVRGNEVHHENDIKDDNSWDNLIVMSKPEHRKYENNFTKNKSIIFPDSEELIKWLKKRNLPTNIQIIS